MQFVSRWFMWNAYFYFLKNKQTKRTCLLLLFIWCRFWLSKDPCFHNSFKMLSIVWVLHFNQVQFDTVANNTLKHFFLFFQKNKAWHFMWINCLADDSNEMLYLNFSGEKKKTNSKKVNQNVIWHCYDWHLKGQKLTIFAYLDHSYLPAPSPKLVSDHNLTVLSLLALMNEFSLSRHVNDRILLVWPGKQTIFISKIRASIHIMFFLFPVSILYKSIAGRYRPVRVADGPITAHYRFIIDCVGV